LALKTEPTRASETSFRLSLKHKKIELNAADKSLMYIRDPIETRNHDINVSVTGMTTFL
jgi:hypothetical protein